MNHERQYRSIASHIKVAHYGAATGAKSDAIIALLFMRKSQFITYSNVIILPAELVELVGVKFGAVWRRKLKVLTLIHGILTTRCVENVYNNSTLELHTAFNNTVTNRKEAITCRFKKIIIICPLANF